MKEKLDLDVGQPKTNVQVQFTFTLDVDSGPTDMQVKLETSYYETRALDVPLYKEKGDGHKYPIFTWPVN